MPKPTMPPGSGPAPKSTPPAPQGVHLSPATPWHVKSIVSECLEPPKYLAAQVGPGLWRERSSLWEHSAPRTRLSMDHALVEACLLGVDL